jgi:ABC-type polysaccharide/polyol phosphate transport system ATPase subunit
MVSITVRDACVSFPLLGGDSHGLLRAKKQSNPKGKTGSVGGAIQAGARPSVLALDKINLDLKHGDKLAIHGHNGSGKSTLLRLLAGIYPPSSGTVEITGTTAGMFSLSLGMIRDATGLENIRFKGIMHGLSSREIEDLIPRIAEFSELGDYMHLPVKTYSSGMIMRLMFATASMMRPDILLLDEWVSAGDQNFRMKADDYLQSILESTPIVIIASQNLRKLTDWSNKLIHLEGGCQAEPPELAPRAFKPDSTALELFKRLNNLHKYDEALQAVEDVWPRDKAAFLYHKNRAAVLLRAKRLIEAERSFGEALTERKSDPGIHNALGKLKLRMKDPYLARHHILRALELSHSTVGDLRSLEKAEQIIAQKLAKEPKC